jgi:hypothetical protein
MEAVMQRAKFMASFCAALLMALNSAGATESAKHNDMNGDGRSDLLWRNATTGAMVYWTSANSASAAAISVKPSTPGGSYDPRAWAPVYAMSDLWGNPELDMLMVRSVSGHVQQGLWPGGGSYWFSTTADGFADGAAAHGDFNGDGAADLLYRDPQSGKGYIVLDVLLRDWGSTYMAVPTLAPAWTVADTGDFDGDGSSDLLWRNITTGQNAIWRSGNSATQLYSAPVNLDWKIVAVGDFDGDGRSDIFWRNVRTGADVIWRSGNGLTREAAASVTDLHWNIVSTGDFDGDGRWDVVWRHATTGANVMWKSASYASRVVLRTVSLDWSPLM